MKKIKNKRRDCEFIWTTDLSERYPQGKLHYCAIKCGHFGNHECVYCGKIMEIKKEENENA